MKKERILITVSQEQKRRLRELAGSNASGFIQAIIDKLYTMKGSKHATQSTQQSALRSVGNE